MSIKLKAFGLGLLAMMGMAAFVAVNASATGTGHFISPVENTVITGVETEGTSHTTALKVPGLKGIVCKHALYEGTAKGKKDGDVFTSEDILVTPTYKECKTEGGTAGETTVHPNECGFTFTIGTSAVGHNQVHIVCKGVKKYIAITHQGCEIRVPEQTVPGISYTTDVVNGRHAITLDATTGDSITTHFEAGFCVLLGTTKVSSFSGSATVTGFEDKGVNATFPYGEEGAQVDITATGSEGT